MFGRLGSFGQDCGSGEYYDEIVKECLCKPGYVPSPLVGSCVPDPGTVTAITPPKVSAPASKPSLMSSLPSWAPWAIGGVAALGLLALAAKKKATPNRRRRYRRNGRTVPKHAHKCFCAVKN